MEVLKLDKIMARKLFQDVPKWFQETLVSSFGAGCFSENLRDRIKSFEDACLEADEDPYDVCTGAGTNDELAYQKLKLIISVFNKGWIPNWKDTNEKKWYPWFSLSSGFGFGHSSYHCTCTATPVGSRLCFKNKEDCDYVATQFIYLYEALLTYNIE